jgi:hypothetical protein
MNKKSRALHRGKPKNEKRATRKTPLGLMTLFPEYRKSIFNERIDKKAAEHVTELREAYLHLGLVLYVGAGVSMSLTLPSWSELVRSLTIAMMTRKVQSAIEAMGKMDVKDERYWRVVLEIQEDVEKSADYKKPILMMARAIKDELKEELPYAISRVLDRHLRRAKIYAKHRDKHLYIGPNGYPFSDLLASIVCLARAEREIKGVQAIINYNFDDTLDEALRMSDVRCITVRSGKDKVPQGALPCYHVHGVLPLGWRSGIKKGPKLGTNHGNFVFSEDEYHAEYSDQYKWSNMTQISLLGRYTGLFVGLSLEDPNLRRLIDVTNRQYPDIHNYAILPRKQSLEKSHDSKECVLRNLFEQVETSSFEKIGVRIIWVDQYTEIPSVLHQICTGEKPKPNKRLNFVSAIRAEK